MIEETGKNAVDILMAKANAESMPNRTIENSDIADDAFDALGIKTESSNDVTSEIREDAAKNKIQLDDVTTVSEKREAKSLFCTLTASDRDQAVRELIIPKSYRDVSFDAEKVKNNIKRQNKRTGRLYKVYNFTKYIELCNTILSDIRMGILPNKSYIIGAPNGFGKTSFVNECLITLRKHGFRVVPYISLIELAGIRTADEQRYMKPYRKFKVSEGNDVYYLEPNVSDDYLKRPQIIQNGYSFSEYINADCLFVSFSDVVSKEVESHLFYQLLNIRAAKGLPTIATISTSLDPYENDRHLKEYIWDEIKAYLDYKDKEADGCYDRVFHISCYRRKEMNLTSKDVSVDNDDGIVS